jgi:hypothetical protein
MASHLVQPARPLPTASLLPFLLRQPEDHRGQQNAPFRPSSVTGLDINKYTGGDLRGQCSVFVSDRHSSPTSHGIETA